MASFIDPFGAPEYLVSEIGPRELICGELVRLPWCTIEGGERILKVKLLVPLSLLILERSRTDEYLAGLPKRRLM